MGAASVLGAAVRIAPATLIAAAIALYAGAAQADLYYLIVGGLGGDPVYAEDFARDAAAMAAAAKRTLGDDSRVTVLSGDAATRDALRSALGELSTVAEPSDRLAVFLIGHGSYDGTDYKFNLPGPDIDGTELAELLAAVPAKNQLIVDASSASGAVLETLAGDGRTVITATRSGRERNATRFAEHWAKALSADEADLDKNGSISAQEAFDYAARLDAESFEEEGTLATEHPEIRGDAASAFEVSRLSARAAATPEVEALNRQREDLEEQIADLRLRREELGDDYLPQLQALLVELARVQEQIDAAAAE
jgi:polyhydroxyalkanoate synthesis regulator phasin